ncbi:unnamed protein product [Rhizophagus irregularis]|nr:unnamed protein product [Rhizophagus irregularis]
MTRSAKFAHQDVQSMTAMYCDTMIKGKRIPLIVNTGAAGSIVTCQLLNDLGIAIDRPSAIVMINVNREKKRPLGEVLDFQITVGGVTVPINMVVIDVESYSAIVGNDWLSKVQAQLNYKASTLLFTWQGREVEISVEYRIMPHERMIKQKEEEARIVESKEEKNEDDGDEEEKSDDEYEEEELEEKVYCCYQFESDSMDTLKQHRSSGLKKENSTTNEKFQTEKARKEICGNEGKSLCLCGKARGYVDAILHEQQAIGCYYCKRQEIGKIRERSVALPFLHNEITDIFAGESKLPNVGELTETQWNEF